MTDTKQLIKYVDTLDKAIDMIDSLSIPKEIKEEHGKKIKDVLAELSFIIEDIDNEYHKEFYGEQK
tara:strand:- start:804 stop:1001 length:198 start_codon:yes stop_codon:yes gene_type:complete